MPFSKIHAPDTLPDQLCREVGERLHDSLVETCAVHPDDNFYLISKYSDAGMSLHPTFLGARDVRSTIIVEIVLLRGRSDEQKEALFLDFRERIRGVGVEPGNSIVFLIESGPSDWSFSDAGSVKTVLEM